MKNEVEITNTIARFRNKLDGWRRLAFTIIPLALNLAWFSLSPQTRADCTDGCFASDNTALGDHAGADPKASNNTAVGSFCMPLLTVPPGSFNTAVGSLYFYNAENGNDNTVIGYSAMGTGNGGVGGRSAGLYTAGGAYTLFLGTHGPRNTAAGDE